MMIPSEVVAAWIHNQFEQIETLQMAIMRQQSEITDAVDELNIKTTLVYTKVKTLQSVAVGNVSPELEKEILRSRRLSTKIDEAVPDVPAPEPKGN